MSKKNKILKISFNWDQLWGDSLIISHEETFLNEDVINLFFILKSYVNNEAQILEAMYMVVEGSAEGRKVVLKTSLWELKKIKDLDYFCEWWAAIGLKNWKYEGGDERIAFLLIINRKNLEKKYKGAPLDILIPKFPWNEVILKKLKKDTNRLEDLKKKLLNALTK